MLRPVTRFALCSLMLVASPVFGVFSEFVSVSPATDSKHQHMRPVIKVEGPLVTIRLPYREEGRSHGRKYWLVISDKPLTKEKQEFRNIILGRVGARSDIVLMTALGPSPNEWDLNKMYDKNYIFLHLTRELAQRAYVYSDYPAVLADGGYYYTVDIPSYLPKEEQK